MATIEYKPEKLSASNFQVWKTIMTSQLKSKQLWDYVDQLKLEDEDDEIGNEKAKSLIYVAMEPQQIAATGVCQTAHELWTKIAENYQGAESTLRSTSLSEFLGLKIARNETIISFAGRYETSLGKLESTGHIVDEKTKHWAFSNSLPQHMMTTVQMFTIAFPEGAVSDLISQLKMQHHMTGHNQDGRNAAYQAQERTPQASSSNKPSNKISIICNYCKKEGHKWRECRKLKNDNDRKKRFGQANQQNRSQHQHQQPHKGHPQKDDTNQQNKTDQKPQLKHSGAFSANSTHDFSEGKYSWIVDSGASSHMTRYKEFLTNYVEFSEPYPIYLGDGHSLNAQGSGLMPFENDEFTGELEEVLWVPEITENLFSICRAMSRECNVQFIKQESTVLFYRNNEVILRGQKKTGSTYFLLTLKPIAEQTYESALLGATLEEWHKRLGHCSMDTVQALIQSDAVTGLNIEHSKLHECHACIAGKICRAHHPQRQHISASDSAAVLHLDTVGPMKKPSIGGSRYFTLATEEYSGYKLVAPLGTKDAASNAVKQLINETELLSKRPVKAIVTDNGSEFVKHDFRGWLTKRGIIHTTSATYTPEQNGRAERANRTILDGMRTLLADSGLPEELWAEALKTAVYTSNRIPNSKNKNKTRYELLVGQKPNISNLRIFGQKALVKETNSSEGKLAPRVEEATFVGYTERFNTYRFYTDMPVQQVFVSCDARFIDKSITQHKEPDRERLVKIIDDEETIINDTSYQSMIAESETTEVDYSTSLEEADDENNINNDSQRTVTASPATKHRITRSHTRSKSLSENIAKESSALVGASGSAFFALDNEPRTFKDAQESDDWPQWSQAMDEEIQALEKNETWILVNKPAAARPIKNKWVFKAKLKPDGTVDRFKARLVAKGFTQIPNIDFKETYAPVASMTTIRLFLSIANQNGMHVMQFDIKTAFLYGDLDEELYMEQPEHYIKAPNKVCKLMKSLYGLKQAPRQWNRKFDSFLKLFSLEQSTIDRCLYYSEDRSLLLAIYVDDGLVAGQNKKRLNALIKHLQDNFELKVMDCEHYLGLEISRNYDERTLSISQSQYIDKILRRFNMMDCKPISTPEQMGAKFDQSELLPTDNQFKELVGSLLYLTTCSRPDISHAVSIASRTAQPTQAHWVALKRILRYLKGTQNLGIRFRWESPNKLTGYSDSDYANDEETRKSTTGYCIFYGGGPITWRCQRQPIITLSTTEAEYVAGCDLVKEILPIRQQLINLNQINEQEPTTIYIDNQSTVRIASNEGGQNRTKHIDIREKWLTEQVQKRKIEVKHISGDEQAADILTKPLYKAKFASNRSKLMTFIVTAMTVMTICTPLINCRELAFTDPITTIKSEKALVNGDLRYKLATIFTNACDNLFAYSTNIKGTESLIRRCYDYYESKHLDVLTNCKRHPNIGPDLKEISLTYDCNEDPSPNKRSGLPDGKCDITRRNSGTGRFQDMELAAFQKEWDKYRISLANTPSLTKKKRFIPALAVGAVILSMVAGPAIKTYRLTEANSVDIKAIANITDVHTQALRESADFFDHYKNSVEALTTWADDIEQRLGDDGMGSRFYVERGKKANLVKSYMQWFDNQERLLLEINSAASVKKIPKSLKNMVNGSHNFELAANLSTLYDCSYRLENKNMILELDFIIPTFDENIEILRAVATDIYTTTNHSDERGEEVCWETYTGPTLFIHNKTSGCTKAVSKNRVDQDAIRGQTCFDPVNDLYFPPNRNDHWKQETCYKEAPSLSERVQITEINGFHKIYCYPFIIEFEKDQQPCPNSTFMLEGHASYKIENITHHGAYIDASVSRNIRLKRSPLPQPATVINSVTNIINTTVTPKSVETALAPRAKFGETIRNLTAKMDISLNKLRQHLKLLPDSINITSLNITTFGMDEILDGPLRLLQGSYESLSELFKELGSLMGFLAIIVGVILIMPIIEVVMISFRVAKVPLNLWLGSARRVTTNLKWASSTSLQHLPGIFKKKKNRWTNSVKAV